MARKVSDKRYQAKLVTSEIERKPCAFCLREVDDEITFGKLYSIGDIQCHYFCCLLSCCLIQKGQDNEGLFGFMYSDILAEIVRSKKHKCSYCNRSGATLGCAVSSCRKQFHLPCGREKNAISLYYGTYKSFCQHHTPKQRIPEHIMDNARQRKRIYKNNLFNSNMTKNGTMNAEMSEEMVCVICYEAVDGFPTHDTFWPPCCARDAWFHRSCLQRMALSAGMHYLKCPLCNDKEQFYDAVVSQGFYVPDRDAAWELEQNAFAEIYERPLTCSSDACACPMGREHDSENGEWDIKLCLLCGSAGVHALCLLNNKKTVEQKQNPTNPPHDPINTPQDAPNTPNPINISPDPINPSHDSINLPQDAPDKPDPNNISHDPINQSLSPINPPQSPINPSQSPINPPHDPINPSQSPINPITQSQRWDDISTRCFVCKCCLPAAPEDLDALANNIEAIIQREQAINTSNARRPIMPSRMSLRRTKGRIALPSSSSNNNDRNRKETVLEAPSNIQASRLELNLKSPKKMIQETSLIIRNDNKLLSPFKLLEQSFKEKVVCTGVRDAVLDDSIIEKLRKKFRKPRPLSEKKKIVNDILDGLFDDLMNVSKEKENIREWCTPKKYQNENNEDSAEKLVENNNLNSPTRSVKLTYFIDNVKTAEKRENKDILIKDENVLVCLENTLQNDENLVENIEKTTELVDETDVGEPTIKEEKKINSQSKNTGKKTKKNKRKYIRKSKKSRPKSSTKKCEPDSESILKRLLTNESSEKIYSLQNSSLEISENNDKININMVKLNQDDDAYKKLNITLAENSYVTNIEKSLFDFESFKKEYLNEVDRFKFYENSILDLNLNNTNEIDEGKTEKSRKRKLSDIHDDSIKKRKREVSNKLPKNQTNTIKKEKNPSEKELKKRTNYDAKELPDNDTKRIKKGKKRSEIERKQRRLKKRNKNIELTIDSANRTGKDKIKTKFPIHSEIKLKIKWKKKQFSLNIESNDQARKKKKILKKKETLTKLKQYVLKFPEGSSKEVLEKPEKEVNRLKRKYVKQEKSPDKFKQMSIQNFFKVTSPNEKKVD